MVETVSEGLGGGIAVVTDFPTYLETRYKRPLVGLPRKIMEACLKSAGYAGPVYWMCAVKTQHMLGKHPTWEELDTSRERLIKELLEHDIKKVLVCGQVAFEVFFPTRHFLPLTKFRGFGQMFFDMFTVSTYNPYTILRDPDLFRDLANDVVKLVSRSEPYPEVKAELVVPKTLGECGMLVTQLLQQEVMSCDLETTGFDYMTEKVISIGFSPQKGRPNLSIIFPREILELPDGKFLMRHLFRNYRGKIIFHNCKFDLKFLTRYLGFSLLHLRVEDTMLLHYALDERPIGRYAGHGLKDCARVYYDDRGYKISFKDFYEKPEEERDYPLLYRYQALDTLYTLMLYRDLSEEVARDPSWNLQFYRDLLILGSQTFCEVELTGVPVDVPYLEEQRDAYLKKAADARDWICHVLPQYPKFNPLSPKQVSDLIWKEWKLHTDKALGGGVQSRAKKVTLDRELKQSLDEELPGTGREMLLQLAKDVGGPMGGIIEAIVNCRQDTKVARTYFKGLLDLTHTDGRIRTDMRLAGTATGRLASSRPNLQNIPNLLGPVVRNAFIARPGYTLLQADYSQLELRVVCLLSRDELMAKTFRDGVDIHRIVASAIFGKPPEEINYVERYLAKRVDFGILYGRTAKAIVEGGEMDLFVEQGGTRFTEAQAQKFIDDFLGGFPQLNQWIREQKARTLREQYCESIFGRRRRFPLIMAEMRSSIERQAVNTPIQSAASDICLSALCRIHAQLPVGATILLSVHDSILLEVREDLVEQVARICKYEMEDNIPVEKFLPFPIDLERGPRWGELEKYHLPVEEEVA